MIQNLAVFTLTACSYQWNACLKLSTCSPGNELRHFTLWAPRPCCLWRRLYRILHARICDRDERFMPRLRNRRKQLAIAINDILKSISTFADLLRPGPLAMRFRREDRIS